MKFKVFFKKGNNELNYAIILNRLSIFLSAWDKYNNEGGAYFNGSQSIIKLHP